MYFVIAKYKSKYGLIVYATKISEDSDLNVDLDNCYINTLYFKGSQTIKLNEVYSFQTIKGDNGLTYAFL
jgi:hypothetical protein